MDYLRAAACVPIVTIIFLISDSLGFLSRILSSPFPASSANLSSSSIHDDQHQSLVTLTDLLNILLGYFSYIYHDPNSWLCVVLLWRYYRFIGNYLAQRLFYKPSPIPAHPTITEDNVHVIVPTIDPENADFKRTIESVLDKGPRWLSIVTSGDGLLDKVEAAAEQFQARFPHTRIFTMEANQQNKRVQLSAALTVMAEEKLNHKDSIVVFVDDHAWWEGDNYLKHLLAPFEDPKIGLVGTRKRVERFSNLNWSESFLNFIGCVYLERHNFEITGQNAMDGGVLVVSARTCAIRASIVLEEKFIHDFQHEYFFFGMFGPLNADDDNFVTRHVYGLGWKVKFQSHPTTMMHTTIGIDGFRKFHGQLLRWSRTQWRSNPATLFTEGVALKHRMWWTWHAAYAAWFINYSLLTDIFLVRAWYYCTLDWFTLPWLLALMAGVKIAKLSSHFSRHPKDVFW